MTYWFLHLILQLISLRVTNFFLKSIINTIAFDELLFQTSNKNSYKPHLFQNKKKVEHQAHILDPTINQPQ